MMFCVTVNMDAKFKVGGRGEKKEEEIMLAFRGLKFARLICVCGLI